MQPSSDLSGGRSSPAATSRGDEATQQRPLGAVACCSVVLLTRVLLMTSSHSKADRLDGAALRALRLIQEVELVSRAGRKSPSATKNLLEVTDGLHRPS